MGFLVPGDYASSGLDRAEATAGGLLTKRLAESWLRSVLDEARRGTLPGLVKTGATFADAAAEYLRYIEHDRVRMPSTLRGYRSAIGAHLLPAFGGLPVEAVTTDVIERWIAGFGGSVRTRNKLLIQLHGILRRARKAYGISVVRPARALATRDAPASSIAAMVWNAAGSEVGAACSGNCFELRAGTLRPVGRVAEVVR